MSEFERKKEYLIRSLFYDSPDLSTIPEDSGEFSQASSRPFSPEPHRLDTHCPPPAHTGGLWSPLPPLTIELVKEPNKHDEPEEFYKRLHRKILKIYNRIFFEDRSDISDINTSGDDDTPTYDQPIDYSTSRVELVESSVNDMAADQENHENVTTDDTKNRRSSVEIELQIDTDDGSHSESHDDKSNDDDDSIENDDDEGGLPNLEPDDGDIPNLEDNVESDDERVSSSTDIVANSTESDGCRDSVTPLCSTVVLSRGTSDQETCLERNEVQQFSTHHIDPEAEGIDKSRISPILLAGSMPRGESILNEENVDLEDNMETDNEVMAEADTPRPREGTHNKSLEENTSFDTDPDNNSVQSEVEEMRTPRPHHSTGSPTHRHTNVHPIEPKVVIIEHHASMESDTDEEEIPIRPNNTNENPENLDLFDLVRISSPKDVIENNTNVIVERQIMKSDTNEEEIPTGPNNTNNNPDNLDLFDLVRISSPKEIIKDNTNVIVEFHAMESKTNKEEMPERPNNTTQNPENLDLFDLVRTSSPKGVIKDSTNVVVEHHAIQSDTNEEEIHKRPNNPNINTENLNPKDFTEANTNTANPDVYQVNISSEDNSRDFPPEHDSIRKSPNDDNNRKRKSVSPCDFRGKEARFLDKSVQTDHNSNEIILKVDIINNLKETKMGFSFNLNKNQ